MCMAYHREHNIDIRIARIFNTYGTKMKLSDGRVIPTFISQALSGKDITIFGDGSHTRSFCFVDDLVEGIYNLSVTDDLEGIVVNLGNPDEFTIKSLAEKIISLTGSDSTIIFHDIPEDDPPIRKPDISKAEKLLGFSPKISLEAGLKKIIPWFQRRING